MGYQISYEKEQIKKSKKQEKKVRMKIQPRWRKGIGLLLPVLLALCCLIPQFRSWLFQLLLPGDASVTAQALEDMLVAVEQGTPFREAMSTFCKDIIGGAA